MGVTDIWTRVWRSLAISVQISPEAPVDFAAELLNIWMIFTSISIECKAVDSFKCGQQKASTHHLGLGLVNPSQADWQNLLQAFLWDSQSSKETTM